MSPVDRAWLLLERPANPMMIVAVIILGRPLTRAQLRRLIAERFIVFERFQCHPVQEALAAHWARTEPFDLDGHVIAAALPGAGGQPELESLVGELASTPFNPTQPRWSFHLIEHYQGGSAIVARIHHSYADGIALMRVLLGLTDEAVQVVTPASTPVSSHETALSLVNLYAPVANLVANTLREGADLIEHGLHYALHPAETAGVAREAAGVMGELARITAQSDDPPTCLKRPLSGVRRVAWAAPLVFEEVRTIGHVLGCTINDVLVATLAGALGRYLASQGGGASTPSLHAAVPVNMRPDEGSHLTLGNRFGLVFVELPIGIRHPLERLYTVHAAMQALKGSSQALVTMGLLATIGSLPATFADTAGAIFSRKASLVASNLPGPRTELRIAGAPVSQILFWVPQAGDIGTGVSMLSYNGQVQFGVMSDRKLIAEPERLVELIEVEFEQLVHLVLLGAVALAE